MKTVLIFIVLCLASGLAFGQKSTKDVYKIRAKGLQLVVTFQGKSHKLNTVEQIDAAKITDTKILFATKKDNFTYLVIDVSGQSREKENDRQCGAGIEANLLWIKLDSAWNISAINSVRYESCWSSIDMGDGIKISGNVLKIEFDNFREDINVKLSYNSDEPEKGFQIEQTPLKENK